MKSLKKIFHWTIIQTQGHFVIFGVESYSQELKSGSVQKFGKKLNKFILIGGITKKDPAI
jgi:hypothetical protein